ncbi:CpaF family protein [Kiloniella litopenaei]|uniref:CpaF family protein n=1 Tax=Kiloniella litopenaei TaxID=1549748 RepID=UPI000696475C|nr:ATPase, T2SS/T4P/T4SS family [Kiloniella litopenaei]
MSSTQELIRHYSGPIVELLSDQTVTEICVNKYDDIWIERSGKLQKTGSNFDSEAALQSFVTQIANSLNQSYDNEEHPILDARLDDGTRINVISPSIGVGRTAVSIRPYREAAKTFDDLLNYGSIEPKMIPLFSHAINRKFNIIISGGTGSGKTTLLRALCSLVNENERVITVEDTCEHLMPEHPHVVAMEAPKRRLKAGRLLITMVDLIKNSLRQRPDRIVVGEIRTGEAAGAFIEAINTGHQGALTSIHANNVEDMLSRLTFLFATSVPNFSPELIERHIKNNIDLGIQVNRGSDGSRRVTEISWIKPDRSKSDLFVYSGDGWTVDQKNLDELYYSA